MTLGFAWNGARTPGPPPPARGRRASGLLAGVVLAGLLSGCAAVDPPRPSGPLTVAADPVLVAAREDAGIDDCPATDLNVRGIAGGLPDVVLGCLGSGRQVNLAALRGRPMVVNIWAQWCGPCRLEAPHLAEFADEAGDKVLVLGLNYDDREPALAIEFAGLADWRYPQVTDPVKRVAGPLRLSAGIPVTLLVDADGVIAYRITGGIASTEALRDLVRTHLKVDL